MRSNPLVQLVQAIEGLQEEDFEFPQGISKNYLVMLRLDFLLA